MRRSGIVSICSALALACSLGPASAQDDELAVGKEIFVQMCSGCHGAQGNGDGEIAELFKIKPRALSQLSKENDGKYPFDMVYGTLKATVPVKGHGGGVMPVWGGYFRAEEVLNDPAMDERESFVTLGKILSVVYYIETLQEE